MANLYLQKYRIALGDAMRDNQTGGAVFDQYMLCGEPGDPGFIGAQNITATVIGTDTSDGNITPKVVLAGYKGYAKGEMIVGEVPAMPQPTVSGNVVTVYAGFNQTERVVTIPEAGALTVAKNKVTVPVGYIKSQRTAEIPVKTATLLENTVTIPEGYTNGQSLSVPVVSAVNDGEFVTVPVGYIRVEQKFKVAGGVEIDFVTATANDILAGKVGADISGNPVYGNIQTVTATLTDNVVTVPKGNIAEAQTLTVETAKNATVSGNVVTIYKGYNAGQYTATVPKATSSVSGNVVTIPAGYHDAATKTVAEMAEPSVSANVVTIPVGYNKAQKTKTIAEAGQTTVSGNVVTTPPGYVKSERKTTVGTAKGASTITPGTADQTVAAGTYLSGALTVKGDANFTEENIADGVSMWGKVGKHKGGSSMEFYKCASVDTSAKTWTGYKAVLTDGVYSFEESVTSGLTYTAITPVIGRVYTADALCEIKKLFDGSLIPTEGQVFYVPLAQASTTAETGQTLTPSGNVTYSTVDGIPCAAFDGQSYLSFQDDGLPIGATPRTVSIWLKPTASMSDVVIFNYGADSSYQRFGLFLYDSRLVVGIGGGVSDYVECNPFDLNKWYHIALTLSSNTVAFYVDGQSVGSITLSTTPNTTLSGTGYICHRNGEGFNGCVASCRIYDRVLSDDEIAELAREFTTDNGGDDSDKTLNRCLL
jgi:hypothetical protein